MRQRYQPAAIAIGLLFFLPRWLSLGHPYYQDDAKIPLIVDPAFGRQGANPHPPLGEALQSAFGALAGYDHLRWLPFLFSLGNLLLVYRLGRTWGGANSGGWSAFILAGTFYSVLSSTMLDVDGALMPFFGLLAMLFYTKGNSPVANGFWKSHIPTAIACATGLLLKFIFLLLPAALILDGWLKNPHPLPLPLAKDGMGPRYVAVPRTARHGPWPFRARVGRSVRALKGLLVPILAGMVWFGVGLAVLRLAYDRSDITHAFQFAGGFQFFTFDRVSLSHKAFEFTKCLLYASPWILLVLPGLRNVWTSARPALLFVAIYIVVHSVALQLEGRAIDRYFGMIVPFAALLAGISASGLFSTSSSLTRPPAKNALIPLVLAALPLVFLIFPGRIIPLYPKSGFLAAIAHGDWTTLIPFRGGNGPAGFYVPMGLVATSWLLAVLGLAAIAVFHSEWVRRTSLRSVLALGLGSNLVFAEEFALGLRYGNPSRLAKQTLAEVTAMKEIPHVLTYDDIGLYELTRSGQYGGRFYAVPEYWPANRRKFQEYPGSYFLVVDFPLIARNGPYWHYLETCAREREWQDGLITAFLARCPKPGA